MLGETKTKGGEANESDESFITNALEATTSFPGCALLWKKFGSLLTLCLNFLQVQQCSHLTNEPVYIVDASVVTVRHSKEIKSPIIPVFMLFGLVPNGSKQLVDILAAAVNRCPSSYGGITRLKSASVSPTPV